MILKRINWRMNRITIFLLFSYTALYSLIDPKPAKRIMDTFKKGLEAKNQKRQIHSSNISEK